MAYNISDDPKIKIIPAEYGESRYDIVTGFDTFTYLDDFFPKYPKMRKCAVIADDAVYDLHFEKISRILDYARVEYDVFKLPHGESTKNMQTLSDILSFFADKELCRNDVAIAFGGGVTGDITALAASLYMRGIRYIQIPTTLVAIVDSSFGGKSAIDLPEGKNLVGAFSNPSLVFSDLKLLSTLPDDELSFGMAEIIKCAVINKNVYAALEKGSMVNFIVESIKAKLELVTKDPFDKSDRRKLNFGHTLGHAIENASNYLVPHGKAVAMGMYAITKACVKNGTCADSVLEKLDELYKNYSLTKACPFKACDLMPFVLHDKKRDSGTINAILPKDIGDVAVTEMNLADFEALIKLGLGE